jgi:hypothetical protein
MTRISYHAFIEVFGERVLPHFPADQEGHR